MDASAHLEGQEHFDPLALALEHLGEDHAYLVGGRIRDRLLGRPSLDTDLALPAGAIAAARRIAEQSGGSLVVLDRERDVARVVWTAQRQERASLLETTSLGPSLDIARFTAADIEADLAARDFTVNALALPLNADSMTRLAAGGDALVAGLVDPLGGHADIDQQQLRMTGPHVFDADPLRMLRLVRLSAELRFDIDAATAIAVGEHSHLASAPAGERIAAELLKLVAADRDARDFDRLRQLGLLGVVLPEVAAQIGTQQSPPHDRDVYAHGLAVLSGMQQLERRLAAQSSDPPREGAGDDSAFGDRKGDWLSSASAGGKVSFHRDWLASFDHRAPDLRARVDSETIEAYDLRLWWRLAALLHDVGKPHVQRFDSELGRFRFIGHELVGAEIVEGLAARLKLGTAAQRFLGDCVQHHLRPMHLAFAGGASPRAIHRYFKSAGPIGVDVAVICLADNAAKSGVDSSYARNLAQVVRDLLEAWFDRPERSVRPALPVDGRDLMSALALEPGPVVGRLLEAIEEAVAAGELEGREAALEFARRQLEFDDSQPI